MKFPEEKSENETQSTIEDIKSLKREEIRRLILKLIYYLAQQLTLLGEKVKKCTIILLGPQMARKLLSSVPVTDKQKFM